jgi:hypothetical protein
MSGMGGQREPLLSLPNSPVPVELTIASSWTGAHSPFALKEMAEMRHASIANWSLSFTKLSFSPLAETESPPAGAGSSGR